MRLFSTRAQLEARAKKGQRVKAKVAGSATPSREGVAPLRRARSIRVRVRAVARRSIAWPARRSARETTAPVN